MARILLGNPPVVLLNGAAATGVGSIIDVSSYDEIVIGIQTKTSAAATIKIAGSMQLTAPAFTSQVYGTDVFDYIDMIPFNGSATPVVGATGVVLTGTDIVKYYTVDVKYVKWITAIVTAYSAGVITATLSAANNFAR